MDKAMTAARQQPAGRNPCAARRKSAATVEFALVASIFFLFVFAALEFARYNMILQTASNAAFDAARACIVPQASATLGQAAGTSTLNAAGIVGGSVTISPSTITNATTQITATVTVPVTRNLWTSANFFTNGTVTKSCTLIPDWLDSAH